MNTNIMKKETPVIPLKKDPRQEAEEQLARMHDWRKDEFWVSIVGPEKTSMTEEEKAASVFCNGSAMNTLDLYYIPPHQRDELIDDDPGCFTVNDFSEAHRNLTDENLILSKRNIHLEEQVLKGSIAFELLKKIVDLIDARKIDVEEFDELEQQEYNEAKNFIQTIKS